MNSRRVLRAAEAIREVVSTAILLELTDPRIENVTVTYVEVAGDMRTAKIHVSIMGDEKQQTLTLHGLRSAAGYLQQQIGERIDTRYIPRLKFVLDQGVKHSLKISRILQDVLPSETDSAEEQETDPDSSTHDEITPGSN
jgi:ribosome-binding factor A